MHILSSTNAVSSHTEATDKSQNKQTTFTYANNEEENNKFMYACTIKCRKAYTIIYLITYADIKMKNGNAKR